MTTLLIATDEAGYGPRLGPLAVVATAWHLPDLPDGELAADFRFAPLRQPCRCGDELIHVDDSKAIYRPGMGLGPLHAVMSVALRWSGHRERTLTEALLAIAGDDVPEIRLTPWLVAHAEPPFLEDSLTDAALAQWTSTHLQLAGIRCRLLTARVFNSHCTGGPNKADLLSESTLGLIRSLVQHHGELCDRIVVYCDRHGGRRYYAGVLQHTFADSLTRVVQETPRLSRYELTGSHAPIEVTFTVNGDSFTPVALSSMIAKYLRERMMGNFNEYFRQRHTGAEPLRPTAGYPGDAQRYLQDIAAIIAAEKIHADHLVRRR